MTYCYTRLSRRRNRSAGLALGEFCSGSRPMKPASTSSMRPATRTGRSPGPGFCTTPPISTCGFAWKIATSLPSTRGFRIRFGRIAAWSSSCSQGHRADISILRSTAAEPCFACYIEDPTRTPDGFAKFTRLAPEQGERIRITHSLPSTVTPEQLGAGRLAHRLPDPAGRAGSLRGSAGPVGRPGLARQFFQVCRRQLASPLGQLGADRRGIEFSSTGPFCTDCVSRSPPGCGLRNSCNVAMPNALDRRHVCCWVFVLLRKWRRRRSQRCRTASRTAFTFGGPDNSQFLLDGKPFQMIGGEMHPARIPAEYWRHRIRMAKAMGLNTIAIYVFWNDHEQQEGKYDFTTGARNIGEFLRLAREEGMWVNLRPGPYCCGEWDLGGIPTLSAALPGHQVPHDQGRPL